MDTESLNCNNCGAPLDVPTGANYVTCTHCGSRLAVKHTGAAAYTEVLDRLDQRTETMSADLEQIRLQNELEQIDREWSLERDKYMIEGDNGSKSAPSSGTLIGMVVAGIFGVGFAIFWMANAPGFMGLFGVAFIVLAIVGIGVALFKTSGYSEAEQSYQSRRADVLRRMGKQ